MRTALVLGAGGFIGSHMVRRLKDEGYWVRGVDLKYPEFSRSYADDFVTMDLRYNRNVETVMRVQITQFNGHDLPLPCSYSPKEFVQHKPFDEVYQFAADMGGAGYIFTGEHDADVMHNSAQINLNVCDAASRYGAGKIFYSSSACVYPQELQDSARHAQNECHGVNHSRGFALEESMAYPANPDSEYGWEKIFSERLYLAYARNHGLNVRIARFHNIYGPQGAYKGGKEKAPAAICRKVIESDGEVEIWGTGDQTRSFLYIDDCIDAVRLLMRSEHKHPINIGSEEMVSINDLATTVIRYSGKDIKIKNTSGPVGVMGRNSDNSKLREVLNGWEPMYSLLDGIINTYKWIKSQYQ